MNTARVASFLRVLLLVLVALCASAPFVVAQEGNPPGRAARLSYVRGNVSLQPSGENQWSQAALNYTVTAGDRLYTDQGARAELEVGAYAVRLSETTDLTIANLNDQTLQLGLEQGTIRVSVYELPSGNNVEIDTPNGAVTISAPGNYRVDTDPNNGTLVSVNNGSLQVTGGGANQTVEAGQAAQLTGTNPVQVAEVALPAPDDFDQWSQSRDRRLTAATSRRYVSPYMPGYEDLDSNGRWQEVGAYGPVWYPAGVPAGWVPYRFGHWAWVEPWGWTWIEDEPWGFCPFHYGRWAFIGSAWGWIPGPVAVVPVYAPALVAFVGGPGFSLGFSVGGLGVAAWFPLGPGEPFFPWYHYGGDYLRQVNVTNVRNVTNITNITNITNVSNIRYVNRTVATTAVPATVLRTGQPVAHQVVRVTPQQIAKAQVIPHPEVSPQASAVLAGRPAPAPKVQPARGIAQRLASVRPAAARPAAAPARPTPTSPPQPGRPGSSPPPLITRNPAPERTAPHPAAQPAPRYPTTRAAGGPPTSRPPLITKRPPPPRTVPFEARRPALEQHPGRPLEPQQHENLRAGRPAGPMRDREFPPHPQAAPAPRRSTPPPEQPKRQGEQHPH